MLVCVPGRTLRTVWLGGGTNMCEHALPAGGDSDGIYSYEALESLIKHVKAQEHQKTEFSFSV